MKMFSKLALILCLSIAATAQASVEIFHHTDDRGSVTENPTMDIYSHVTVVNLVSQGTQDPMRYSTEIPFSSFADAKAFIDMVETGGVKKITCEYMDPYRQTDSTVYVRYTNESACSLTL